MTAFTILMNELATRGVTTYARLVQRYGARYDYFSFTAAVHKARKLGLVAPPTGTRGGPIEIVAGARCPCCGREFGEGR